MIYDVAVIGAGVVGALTARELSRYDLKVALIEKRNDVAMGTTKANSAIVHAGFDAVNGTLKAKLNVRGTALMPRVCSELHVPFKGIGSLVVAFSDEELKTLDVLYERGVKNGVEGLEIISAEKLKELEPNVNPDAKGALLAPSAGIVCPYELTIAAAENAAANGTEFFRNFAVTSIDYDGEAFTVSDGKDRIKASYIVNAAGVNCDEIAALIGDDSLKVIARKGEYMLCDKTVGGLVNHVIFQCPNPMGKGVLVTPTVDGNLLLGPTAKDIEDKENIDTTADSLAYVLEKARKTAPSITTREVITSFAGLRAHLESDDFIIDRSEKNDKFINAAGIESPGLSAAPAIAEMIAGIIASDAGKEPSEGFDPVRPEPVRFRHMTNEERAKLIAENPSYGRIVCRCETITEGEILDAIKSPVGARDVDGVKRRTRAGMGRCQGGFCGSKVVELLAKELGVEINEITKFGGDSKILYDRTK